MREGNSPGFDSKPTQLAIWKGKKGTLVLKQLAASWVANNPVPVLDRIWSRRFTPELAADTASHLASLSQLQITRLLTDEAIIEKTLVILLPHLPPSPS